MNKRMYKRIKTHQLAKVGGKTGVVNNVSGVGMLVSLGELPKNRKIVITFEVSGESITVLGVVQWFQRRTTIRNLNQLGIAVKEAPDAYYRYINELTAH